MARCGGGTSAARRALTAAGEDLESGLGDKGVDEAGDEVEVLFVEFGDGGLIGAEVGSEATHHLDAQYDRDRQRRL